MKCYYPFTYKQAIKCAAYLLVFLLLCIGALLSPRSVRVYFQFIGYAFLIGVFVHKYFTFLKKKKEGIYISLYATKCLKMFEALILCITVMVCIGVFGSSVLFVHSYLRRKIICLRFFWDQLR